MATTNGKEIAKTIIHQMGGFNRLVAMVGANYFMHGDDFVQFRFEGSRKANLVEITLNSLDLYDVTYYKAHGINCREVASSEGLFWDMLKSDFEQTTGLHLSL